MAKTKKERFFGNEFLDAEVIVFRKLPKKYHDDVKDLLNKLQLWDMRVFLNIQVAQFQAKKETL